MKAASDKVITMYNAVGLKILLTLIPVVNLTSSPSLVARSLIPLAYSTAVMYLLFKLLKNAYSEPYLLHGFMAHWVRRNIKSVVYFAELVAKQFGEMQHAIESGGGAATEMKKAA